ncbi:MAG: response regulator [Rhodospirillaceae bacterium]|nr:response regulator [Rhodospirillaceae bacterium]
MTEPSYSSVHRIEDLHILAVDDEPSFLDFVEAILKSFGVRKVTRASSGREVYGYLRSSTSVVDCIVSDYSMAEGNGLQLLQGIRVGIVPNVRPDIPFVLLTMSGDEATVMIAKQLDVSSYLVKPVTPAKLKEAILKARSRSFPLNIEQYKQVFIPG